jgi:putative membrane protein
MSYLYIKALHIIFVVTWFSGMFYLCRLYIYQREAVERPENERKILLEQFTIMTRRLLFGITWPSAILTWIFGLWLFSYFSPTPTWLWIKLAMVLLLTLYHYSLHWLYQQHKIEKFTYTSFQLRLWNEVPTLFLLGVVLLVVVKQEMSLFYGGIGLLIFGLVIYAATRIYKGIRKGK